MPDDKACGRVFVNGGPVIIPVNSRESMVSGVVAVEGLVVVKEIAFGELLFVSCQAKLN